jgi:hypothetical protein
MSKIDGHAINALLSARQFFATRPDDMSAVYVQHRQSDEHVLEYTVIRKDWYYGDYALFSMGVFDASFSLVLVQQWADAREAEKRRIEQEMKAKAVQL